VAMANLASVHGDGLLRRHETPLQGADPVVAMEIESGDDLPLDGLRVEVGWGPLLGTGGLPGRRQHPLVPRLLNLHLSG